MNRQKFNQANEKGIFIFEDENLDENETSSDVVYDEEAFLPIDDEPFIRGQIAAVELAQRIKQLENIFDSKNRYYYALEICERTVRYVQGYLKDYTVTSRRELYPNKIRLIIDIEPYDDLNSIDRMKERIKYEIKKTFPTADDAVIERLAERILSFPTKVKKDAEAQEGILKIIESSNITQGGKKGEE